MICLWRWQSRSRSARLGGLAKHEGLRKCGVALGDQFRFRRLTGIVEPKLANNRLLLRRNI